MRLPTTLLKKLFLQSDRMRNRSLPLFIIILFACLAMILPEEAGAQTRRGGRVYRFMNILEHDERPYHFGFSLGYNMMSFSVIPKSNLSNHGFEYVLAGPEDQSKQLWTSGFHIGIVSNLKLGRYFDLRFVPTYVHHNDRPLAYYGIGDYPENYHRASVEEFITSIIDFPLHIKYKSERMNNWRAYVIGGVKYSLDLQNPTGAPTGEPIYVRIGKHDLHYEFGVGFDHYFYYFKFSTEIKASFGAVNLKQMGEPGNERFLDAIDRLNSRSIMVSFLFE